MGEQRGRRHVHPQPRPRPNALHGCPPAGNGRSLGLHHLPDGVVVRGNGHPDGEARSERLQQVQVLQHQGRARVHQDAGGRALQQHLQAGPGQPVLPLDGLVGIGGRGHEHRLVMEPVALGPEQFRGVELGRDPAAPVPGPVEGVGGTPGRSSSGTRGCSPGRGSGRSRSRTGRPAGAAGCCGPLPARRRGRGTAPAERGGGSREGLHSASIRQNFATSRLGRGFPARDQSGSGTVPGQRVGQQEGQADGPARDPVGGRVADPGRTRKSRWRDPGCARCPAPR